MKSKIHVARKPAELAEILGLGAVDAVEWEARAQMNDKIIAAIRQSGLTHAQVARAAGTSRSRITAIVNRNRGHVSTDLLMRILAALGYRTKVTFARIDRAA